MNKLADIRENKYDVSKARLSTVFLIEMCDLCRVSKLFGVYYYMCLIQTSSSLVIIGKNKTTENPPESTPIEHVDLLNHPGGSSSIKDTATLPTSKHHGNLSQSSTYPREETVGSTNYNSSISATPQINWHGKLDDDKNKTKMKNSTDFREESVVSSQYSNSKIAKSMTISESKSDEKNQSKLETTTITGDVIVLGNVSPKSKIFVSLYMFTDSFFFYLHGF